MNTRLFKWLLMVTVLFCLSFVVSDAIAKKPSGKPTDPCIGQQTFSPDFAFWRDSSSNRVPQVTIYLAESVTGCEKKLLDIPLADTGAINDLKLAFSWVEDGEVPLGRVVWARQTSGHAIAVWKYDFHYQQGSVDGDDGPTKILENTDYDNQDINYLDLSPDMQTLVYQLTDNGDQDHWSIRTIDIDIPTCVFPCTFAAGERLYGVEDTNAIQSLRSPVWGPFGTRVYFVERADDYYHLKAIDSSGGLPITLLSINRTEFGIVRQISSGIGYGTPGDKEFIAVTIGPISSWGAAIHGCANVYSSMNLIFRFWI